MLEILKKANINLYPQHLFYAPQWVILAVNNVCNLHCKMCDVGTKNTNSNFYDHMVGTHPLNMPRELIFKIIDELQLYYPTTKLGYAFTEPSVYPFLLESLHYAESKNIYTSMTTNGLQLAKQADELIESGLNEICISLDGPPAIHNEIRGHKQSFEKAVAGIEKLFSNEKCKMKISVFCAITEWNIGYLTEFLSYFKKYPLHQIGFMHTVFNTDEQAEMHNQKFGNSYFATASNMQEIRLENYDLEKLNAEIQSIQKINYSFPIAFQPRLNSLVALENYYRHPETKIGKKCMDVFQHLMIKSDGSVIPAHSRCYAVDAGNIYKESIQTIWNSKAVQKLRSDLSNAGGLFPACTRCCSGFSN
jgi:MoaA/NifB/PqqE/SkfB family radical SAM enzyme